MKYSTSALLVSSLSLLASADDVAKSACITNDVCVA